MGNSILDYLYLNKIIKNLNKKFSKKYLSLYYEVVVR